MNREIAPRAVLLCYFVLCFSCSVGSRDSPQDAQIIQHPTDAEQDGDDGETANSSDATFTAPRDMADAGFDPSPWLEAPLECVETSRWLPDSDVAFQDWPPLRDEPLTKNLGTERANGLGAEWYSKIQWGPNVGTHNGASDAIFLNGLEPLQFSALIASETIFPESTLWVSVMIDYKQVDTTFTRWVDERGGESITTTGPMLRVDDVQNIELIDVEIGPDEFIRGGAHDMAWMFFVDTGPPQVAHIFTNFSRTLVYNGGYRFGSLPCFAAPIRSDYLSPESGLVPVLGAWRRSYVFVPELLDQEDKWATVPASSDAPIYLSILGDPAEPVPMAMTLFANGEMVGEPIYVMRGDGGAYKVSQRLVREAHFEPGEEVDIFAVGWPHPFFPYTTPDGERIEGVRSRSTLVTNTLRLRIEE